MGHQRRPVERLHGRVTHRRTQDSYLGAMLDEVSEDDWRDVVRAALRGAKAGDPSARAFLSAYLIGRPAATAPTPLTVIVRQISGDDPLVDCLAGPAVSRAKYPVLHTDEHIEESIKMEVAVGGGRNLHTSGGRNLHTRPRCSPRERSWSRPCMGGSSECCCVTIWSKG